MTETPTLTQPDVSDELAAGRPFPMRDALEPMNHQAAVALFQARRAWWLDVAQHYVDMAAELAGDPVQAEYLSDGRRALAASRTYAPKAGA